MEFKALINSMLSPIVPKYFLFPQQLDQKKVIFKSQQSHKNCTFSDTLPVRSD